MWWPLLRKAATVQLLLIVTVSEATSFGCKNTLISDKWRQAVLDFHNNNRRNVAKGLQATKGGAGKTMPKADDMYYLNWDCNIENNAFLSSCNGQVQIPTDYGVNKAPINMNKKCNIKDATMTVLKGWWDQALAADLSQNTKYDEILQKEFGVMANGATTGFACSYSNCGGNTGELLCLYNKKPAAAPNNKLYTEAQGDICDACQAATDPCIAYLCTPKVYTPNTKANPQPMCTNPGNPGTDKMTYDMQITARDMANYYRSLVATGWAQDKDSYAPTAKTMNALVYDCDTIGAGSQAQADNCAAASYNPAGGSVLNSYKTDNYNLPDEQVLRQAMESWFGQLKNTDLDEKATYNSNVQKSAPDFANLMIGDATKVGCSVKKCLREGFSVAVCQFDGTAPTPDAPLYTVGKTCSGCRVSSKTRHKALQGICT
ncbi:hypothetical protein Aduo_000169 [Ancylostoma duodenale]